MISLPSLFGNSAYASLFTTLILLSVVTLANYAEERLARRQRREGVLPPDPPDPPDPLHHAVPAEGMPPLVPVPVRGDALN